MFADDQAQSVIDGPRGRLLASNAWRRRRRSAKIYGKRIIVMGGGAQVGQVALGAISEADRHNIRGERISIDTIPLVGEQELAAAVRAVMRLAARASCWSSPARSWAARSPRRSKRCGRNGLRVISLNMAGSVPDAADLVVSDPVQAGVMAVMAVADTAKFELDATVETRCHPNCSSFFLH